MVSTFRFTGAPFRNFQITQKQAGTYVQDQMKLGNFTLVLSGRNDWVETTQSRVTPAQILPNATTASSAAAPA